MKRNAIIVIIAGALVVVLVWFFVSYKPKGDEISTVEDQTAEAERQQQDLQATLARLQSLDRDGPQQAATLEKLNAAIPAEPALADFIFQANDAAAQSGVDWISVAPSPPTAVAGGPSVITLALQVQGGFFQVLDYLNRIEGLDRLVVVGSVNVSTGGDAGAATGGATTQTTLATSSSSGDAPALSVSLSGQMYTRATAAPGAPATPGAPAPTTPTTTAPAPPAGAS